MARHLAVPDPDGMQRLSDTDGWSDHLEGLRRRQPRLLSDRCLDVVHETINDLAQDRTRTLTHGDLHTANVHLDHDRRWRVIDPDPRIGTIAYESHTVIVERSQLDELARTGPGELRRRLALFAEVAAVDRTWSERLCQARAVSSALYEQDRGATELAAGLAWMSEALTPAG